MASSYPIYHVGFIIRVGPYLLAIPVAKVIANTRILPQEIFLKNHKETITFRKSPIFLCQLHTVLNVAFPPLHEGGYLSLVIVEAGKHHIGLIVDDFVGQQEIVIRPLQASAKPYKGFFRDNVIRRWKNNFPFKFGRATIK